MSDTEAFTIHTDGAARGNPGPAAFSFVIARPGAPDVEDHGCLGDTTNNVAEYTALVKALQRAGEIGGRRLIVNSDSELMIKQMRGEYKVKNEGLRTLFEQARRLAAGFDKVTYHHVRREQNRRADALCNEALDGAAEQKPAVKAPATSSASVTGHLLEKAPGHSAPAPSPAGPRRNVTLPVGAREEILDCLRSVACVWSAGNPNYPRPEDVWDQLWTILEDAGVLKRGKPL